jgi:hypothetical protein
MYSENRQPEPTGNILPKKEKREFSGERKKELADLWTQVAIDNSIPPQEISEMQPPEIRKWLFESLIADVNILAEEWGLHSDTELIGKIQQADPGNEREKLEIDYFLAVHEKINERVKSFSRSPEKSTKWDSWPKKMRETGEFNCVGATLLGIRALSDAGIENYLGNPYGHAVNVVKTSAGNWFYVDFRNGKRNVFNLEPEVVQINGVTVLKVKSPRTDYRLIPIYKVEDISSSIIANFSSLAREVVDPSVPDQSPEKKDAKEIMGRYGAKLNCEALDDFDESLFPWIIHFDATPETQEEERRLKTQRNFEDEITAFIRTLPGEVEEHINIEIKKRWEKLISFIIDDDRTVFEGASDNFNAFLKVLDGALGRLKTEPPEIRDEVVAAIVGRIRS